MRLVPTAVGSATILASDPGTGSAGTRMYLRLPLIFTEQRRAAAILAPSRSQVPLTSSIGRCALSAPRIGDALSFLFLRRPLQTAVD